MTLTRRYTDLSRLKTWNERFDYLRIGGGVGRATFGFDRHLNQQFYGSREWHDVRNHVICRDEGCDLGVPGFEIHHELLIHHMNPMGLEDILRREPWILDPEFLVTTVHSTHNAIHYGGKNPYPRAVAERRPGDTRLWGGG